VADPARAFDRLAAIKELLDDLAEAEEEAIIAARMAKVSWSEIGRAYGGMTRQGAFNKWGAMVNRFEAAGVLDTQVFHTYECLDCGWQAIREDQLTALPLVDQPSTAGKPSRATACTAPPIRSHPRIGQESPTWAVLARDGDRLFGSLDVVDVHEEWPWLLLCTPAPTRTVEVMGASNRPCV
jgi:hypothetical protein